MISLESTNDVCRLIRVDSNCIMNKIVFKDDLNVSSMLAQQRMSHWAMGSVETWGMFIQRITGRFSARLGQTTAHLPMPI